MNFFYFIKMSYPVYPQYHSNQYVERPAQLDMPILENDLYQQFTCTMKRKNLVNMLNTIVLVYVLVMLLISIKTLLDYNQNPEENKSIRPYAIVLVVLAGICLLFQSMLLYLNCRHATRISYNINIMFIWIITIQFLAWLIIIYANQVRDDDTGISFRIGVVIYSVTNLIVTIVYLFYMIDKKCSNS